MKKKFIVWIVMITVITGAGVAYKLDLFNSNNDKQIESVRDKKQNNIINIKEISSDIKDQIVTIEGTVVNSENHKNGHMFLTVKDDTGSILVPLFKDKGINYDKIILNNKYSFKGKVDVYNNKVEVIPEEDSDINIAIIKSNEITKENIGDSTTVDCIILSKYVHPNGSVFLTVKTSADQEIQVPVFKNINYDSEKLSTGDLLRISGKIQEYKGDLEVIPNNADDIIVIESGEDQGQATLVSLDQITKDNRGQSIQVRGSVSDLKEKDGHLYFNLSDGGTKKECVLYKADGDILEGKRIRIKNASEADFPIRVSGTVNVYKNTLRLVVDKVYNEY